MDAKSIGISIAKLRKKHSLTQSQLAQKLHISDKTVSRWENGLGYPEITLFPALASIFGVSVDYLMTGERKGITIIGNILTDIVKNINNYPQIGKLSHIKNVSRSVGGCAPNISINLAKIDRSLPISIIGSIGDDEYGRYILSQLSRYNIDSKRVIVSKTAPTSFCDVMTLPSGESTFFHTDGANAQFSSDSIDIPFLHSAILHIGYVIPFGDFDREDSIYGTTTARLLHNFQEQGIKTSMGIMSDNSPNYKEKIIFALKYCDFVILNETESSILSGFDFYFSDGSFNIENIKKTMLFIAEFGVKEKIIIHCKDASFCYDIPTGNFTAVPSLNIPESMIKGKVGVGDAFCAGCLHGIYNGFEDKHILEFAVTSAACCLFSENSTDGMLDKNEIEKLWEKYKGENHDKKRV